MLPNPDVVVVCCGGGGLLAGVAAIIKLSGCEDTRIYGVEPEGGKEIKMCIGLVDTGGNVNYCVHLFFTINSMHHVQKLH